MKCPQTAQSTWFIKLTGRRLKFLALPLAALLMVHPLGWGAIASEPNFSSSGQPSGNGGDSAGSRGDCDFDITPLLPLEMGGGWTTQATPTLWIQVPTELSAVQSMRVEVRDPSGIPVYRAQMRDLAAPAGIIRLPLPDSVQLPVSSPDVSDASDWFTWMVALYCDDSGDRPAYAFGSIRRVAMAGMSASDLADKSSQETSDLYAQNGVWYDALTVLGDARLADPDNPALIEAWQTLLSYSSVGLEAIATEPIVDCCGLPE